jgi:hypothetical protein
MVIKQQRKHQNQKVNSKSQSLILLAVRRLNHWTNLKDKKIWKKALLPN